jgi:pyruvate kinase
MIARGDLFENSGDDPTQYFGWEESLLAADPEAIVASRILQSCESSPTASLEDLRELAFHFSRGTSQIMLADGVCKSAEAFKAAANAYLQFREYWESREALPAEKGGSDGSRSRFWSWLRG